MARGGQWESRISANAAALLWVTAGTALFTLVFASAKLAGDSASAFQILFLRYIGGLGCLLALASLRGEPLAAYRSRRPLSHFARAASGGLGGGCIMLASTRMSFADATAIGLLQGVIAVALGVLLLREIVSPRHWAASALCAGGAAVVVAGQGAFGGLAGAALLPIGVALLGAFLLACESVLLRVLSVADRPMAVLLHVNAFGILIMAGPALLTWGAADPWLWLPYLALGPLAIAAQYCNVRGYRLGAVSLVAPVEYSWLVFAALIGLVAFGEVPGPATLLGSALILLGGVALARLPAGGTRPLEPAEAKAR